MRRIQVIGNLTQDADVRDVNSKKAINLTVATNEKYKDSNGNQVEKAYYYPCTIWRESNTKIAEYLTKGTKVFVEGNPEIEVYKDKNGEIKGSIKINISNIEILGGGTRKETQTEISKANSEDNDDLPF